MTILLKATAGPTRGAFTLFEEVPPLVDAPLHVHEAEGQLFHVLEGEHVFQVGGEELRAGAGGLVVAPRGVPHSQRRVVPTSPAGLEVFRELAAAHDAGTVGPEA